MRYSVCAAALFIVNTSLAEPIDALIGRWISPDGYAKQSIERQFDGSWLTTRMWFKSDDAWKLVAFGSIYRKPQTEHWISASRTTDMDGIVLFETTLRPNGDGRFALKNLATKSDGSIIETEEEWRFVDSDRYEYTVYRFEGTERKPWLEGAWVRLPEED